jgi:hypothetical protein
MERTELMVVHGANCVWAGRISRDRRDCQSLRLPDVRMLCKWKALMRFAPFSTINSILSNGAELRLQSLQ